MNSSELKGFLTGLMFGDGYIDKGVTRRALRIKSIHRDFLDFIKSELETSTNFSISIKWHPDRKTKECTHKAYWELSTKAHPYFVKKYHHFYDDYKHRIASSESLSWLNEIGLANWFMSDGYTCLVGKTKERIRDRRVEIATDRFTSDTVDAMTKMLHTRFGIKCSKIKRGNRYRIRILKDGYGVFYRIVSPYIVESMRYKLYFGYEKKPDWMNDEIWEEQNKLRSATARAA